MLPQVAIITTHPIQYNSPLFKVLAEDGRIAVKVFYTWGESVLKSKYDKGFKRIIEWDIPLLDGYDYEFIQNVSREAGSHSFKGIDNPSLKNKIENLKADCILVFGWSFKSHLKAMHYFKGKVPVYFRGDSNLLDEVPGIKKIFRRLFLKWIYTNVDYAFFVGTKNKEYFFAHGLKDEQLIFAPHSVENDRFKDRTGEYKNKARQWRKELGIKEDEIIFVFAGKFEPKKNPLLLLEVFIELVQLGRINIPKAHLIFIGNGELEYELKKNSYNDSSVQPYIHFLPFQNQSIMPIAYRIGDVFILPSKGPGETWGLAVNEAMACGLPVLVSDKVGCAFDLVKEGYNGFIFKHNSKEELLDKLKQYTSYSNDELKVFGENSKKIINNWRVENTANAIISKVKKKEIV
jgi:glycosyltransferase involved in cell wall biosynthesis